MDIKDLAQEEQNPTAKMVLKHPKTDEPIGKKGDEVIFHIYSPYSDKMQKSEDKISRSLLTGTLTSQMKGGDEDEAVEKAVEDISKSTAEDWLTRIESWENLEYKGKKVKDKKFIAEKLPFAKQQVNKFYGDLENFF